MAEPLLLIPGMMCDARLYSYQIAAFSAERAVQIASVGAYDCIEDMAEAVLDAAPQRFALAGLSMGGIVAMDIVRRAPERVTRIALMDTNSQAETPAVAASREPDMVAVKAGRLPDVLQDMMRPEYLAPNANRNDILALVHAMGMTMGEGVFLRHSKALQRRQDQQKTLRKIRMPALVLCGEYDALTLPRRHEFMSELIPYATLKIIENAGHLPTLEAPEATNAALREWLAAPLILR